MLIALLIFSVLFTGLAALLVGGVMHKGTSIFRKCFFCGQHFDQFGNSFVAPPRGSIVNLEPGRCPECCEKAAKDLKELTSLRQRPERTKRLTAAEHNAFPKGRWTR